jgi:hypothetical protein
MYVFIVSKRTQVDFSVYVENFQSLKHIGGTTVRMTIMVNGRFHQYSNIQINLHINNQHMIFFGRNSQRISYVDMQNSLILQFLIYCTTVG